MCADVLCSRSKVAILLHQLQIDVKVGEAHLEEPLQAICKDVVYDVFSLDSGDVPLLGSD